MLCSGIKKRRKVQGHLWWWHLSFWATATHAEALLPRKWLDTCLVVRSSEYISYFALPLHAAFAFVIKLSLSWPRSFSILFSSPVLLRGVEWETGWVGICQLAQVNLPHLGVENSPKPRLQAHTLSSLSLPVQTWCLNVDWRRGANHRRGRILKQLFWLLSFLQL